MERANQAIVDCHVTHADMDVPQQDLHLLSTLHAGYYNDIRVYLKQYQQVPAVPCFASTSPYCPAQLYSSIGDDDHPNFLTTWHSLLSDLKVLTSTTSWRYGRHLGRYGRVPEPMIACKQY